MKIIFLVVILTVGYIYGMIQMEQMRLQGLTQINSEVYFNSTNSSDSAISKPLMILIAVEGAVKKPGSYKLAPDSLLQEVLIQAGGLRHDADLTALDLSYAFIEDTSFYVPVQGEDKVSINHDGVNLLDELPGIGLVLANRIVTYRTENGPFGRLEELMNVSGIGPQMFLNLRDLISLSS